MAAAAGAGASHLPFVPLPAPQPQPINVRYLQTIATSLNTTQLFPRELLFLIGSFFLPSKIQAFELGASRVVNIGETNAQNISQGQVLSTSKNKVTYVYCKTLSRQTNAPIAERVLFYDHTTAQEFTLALQSTQKHTPDILLIETLAVVTVREDTVSQYAKDIPNRTLAVSASHRVPIAAGDRILSFTCNTQTSTFFAATAWGNLVCARQATLHTWKSIPRPPQAAPFHFLAAQRQGCVGVSANAIEIFNTVPPQRIVVPVEGTCFTKAVYDAVSDRLGVVVRAPEYDLVQEYDLSTGELLGGFPFDVRVLDLCRYQDKWVAIVMDPPISPEAEGMQAALFLSPVTSLIYSAYGLIPKQRLPIDLQNVSKRYISAEGNSLVILTRENQVLVSQISSLAPPAPPPSPAATVATPIAVIGGPPVAAAPTTMPLMDDNASVPAAAAGAAAPVAMPMEDDDTPEPAAAAAVVALAPMADHAAPVPAAAAAAAAAAFP